MGNILGHQAQPGWQPNIPVNDLNRPHTQQMTDMILQFVIPMLFVASMAYVKNRQEADREKLVEEHKMSYKKLEELTRGATKDIRSEKVTSVSQAIAEVVSELEKEESLKLVQQLQELRYYEEGLKTILDIRCSSFKRRDKRLKLQAEMMNRAFAEESQLGKCVSYEALQTIYEHDGKFCGNTIEENGKFRQLYVQHWKSQLELQKYRNIVKKLEQLKPKD